VNRANRRGAHTHKHTHTNTHTHSNTHTHTNTHTPVGRERRGSSCAHNRFHTTKQGAYCGRVSQVCFYNLHTALCAKSLRAALPPSYGHIAFIIKSMHRVLAVTGYMMQLSTAHRMSNFGQYNSVSVMNWRFSAQRQYQATLWSACEGRLPWSASQLLVLEISNT